MLTTELGYGGAESAFLALARELAKRHQVEIALFKRHYASGNYARDEREVDLPIHLLDPAGGGRLSRWRHRISGLRRLKDDLLPDASISFLTGPNLLNALTRRRDKVVVSIRGSRRYDRSQSARSRLFHRYSVDPLTMRLADLVVSVSEGVTCEISGARGTDPPAKFKTISGYVDSARLMAVARAPIEPEIEALSAFPLVVSAGRLAAGKGFAQLLKQFAAVKTAEPDAKLLLLGDGPDVHELARQAGDLGLSAHVGIAKDLAPFDVVFAGFRPDPHRYFSLARAFVLPSMAEGFPNVLVEALATGVPILAIDAPWGAREVLGLRAEPTNNPFPTSSPVETDVGTLMPRMDKSEFAAAWKSILIDRLRHDRRTPELAERQEQRLRQLDVTHAAREWEAALEELVSGPTP